jgi:hypothetical protein
MACSTEESDMAEHNDPPEEGATPASHGPGDPPAPEPPAGPGDRSAVHAHEGAIPQGETLDQGPPRTGRWSGRVRRWSGNGSVRMGAVTLVAGLIGGLVGGGIVAAFNGGGHDERTVPVRVERGMPGGPGFRGPRYYYEQPPYGWMGPNRPVYPRPAVPPTPAPTPSPKSTG